MAVPPRDPGPFQRPQHYTVVAVEAFADPGQRPASGVEVDCRPDLIGMEPPSTRRDACAAQMLGHRLSADVPAVGQDAHVVAGLVLLNDLLGLLG